MTLAILLNDDNCGFASLMVSRKRTLGALLSAILNFVLKQNKSERKITLTKHYCSHIPAHASPAISAHSRDKPTLIVPNQLLMTIFNPAYEMVINGIKLGCDASETIASPSIMRIEPAERTGVISSNTRYISRNTAPDYNTLQYLEKSG